MDESFLEDLASRRRFGMRPGLDAISALCHGLDDPQNRLRAVHVAGTNGKGAVCALLDAALRAQGARVGRYTSPHLVSLNERFFLDGRPMDDAALAVAAEAVRRKAAGTDVTFFEALTAVAFKAYAEASVDYAVLETGLGGRLDATNVCRPCLTVITRIGLDHCDWLGDTVEKIAAEKAGIVKSGVPVVLGRNDGSVREVVERRARELGAPFVYAPDAVADGEIPATGALAGSFNRENAQTATAALKTLFAWRTLPETVRQSFSTVVWPGRFQQVGDFIVDGAHNPPAARALAEALRAIGTPPASLTLVAGFCGDKDVDGVLRILSPFVRRAYAVRTNNARSLTAAETAERMRTCGWEALTCASLAEALNRARADGGRKLVCGSLFLAGEALVALNAYPWGARPFDGAERLAPTAECPALCIKSSPTTIS